jgi:hypothetical protein
VRPEGLGPWKIKETAAETEIESATFELVAQCLNHLHHRKATLRIQQVQTDRTIPQQ